VLAPNIQSHPAASGRGFNGTAVEDASHFTAALITAFNPFIGIRLPLVDHVSAFATRSSQLDGLGGCSKGSLQEARP
jgi:hypothetical protein